MRRARYLFLPAIQKQHTEFWTDHSCLSQEDVLKVRGVLIILFALWTTSHPPFLLHPIMSQETDLNRLHHLDSHLPQLTVGGPTGRPRRRPEIG